MKTMFNYIEEVLQDANEPLTAIEISEMIKKKGYITTGKTLEHSVGSRLYTDMKENVDSKFEKISMKKGSSFALKEKNFSSNIIDDDTEDVEIVRKNERNLHKFLSTFVRNDSNFLCYTRTIFHEKIGKNVKGYNEWLHPDLLGVRFPFNYQDATIRLSSIMQDSLIKLFAFEMKEEIKMGNLRKSYFQAVSNSSFANYGYLVSPRIDKEDKDLREELERLNNAFGIGIILLDLEQTDHSDVMFDSKYREIDYSTLDKLIKSNFDVKEFINDVHADINSYDMTKKYRGKYDDIFSDNDNEAEIAKKLGLL